MKHKIKIEKIIVSVILIFIILFNICPKVFATNGNEMSISIKEGIGNTLEIVSGNNGSIKSESVADVVSYLSGQGVTVSSITNHKGVAVATNSTALIGTGYVLNTNNGNYSVIVYGDGNGDGEVDAGDMKIIIDDFLGNKSATGLSRIAVDVYRDGDLDAADLKLVLDSFLGNLTGNILNETNSLTPTTMPTSTGSDPEIIIGGQTVILTKENAPLYYGKVVTNYNSSTSATWRLFYIDFDGKYGDAGKIYLKADQVEEIDWWELLSLYFQSSNSIDVIKKMKEMNPKWAKNSGVVDDYTEKGALIMYNETLWQEYKNSSYADYVMGTFSVEMYLDSYNEYHTKKGTSGYEQIKYKWSKDRYDNGYGYAVGATNENYNYRTSDNSLKVDENNMYVKSGQIWGAASQSIGWTDCFCIIDGNKLCLDAGGGNNGICPVVSLKLGIVPEIAN